MAIPAPTAPASLRTSLFAGLAAGAVAAVAAALVSLPLRSPDDNFLNTASVTAGALLAGLAAGAGWWLLGGRPPAWPRFALGMAAALAIVAAGALLLNLALAGSARFVIPLAVIVFGLLALLTPPLTRGRTRPAWAGPAGAVAALALGIALAGQGDAERGTLSLPDAPPPAARATTAAGAGAGTDAAASDGLIRAADVAGVEFRVTPGESTATYTVREKLARLPLPGDAVGKTTAVSGSLRLDGQPSRVVVDLSKLQSDQPMRDNFVRRNGPQLSRYPLAEFTVTSLDLPAEYRPGDTVTRDVTGTMKIREVERPVTFAVEARLQGGVLQVLGRTDFTWADFQIPPPNVAGIVQVEDNVHVEVLLVARRDGTG